MRGEGGDEVAILPIVNISASGAYVALDGNQLADLEVGDTVSVFLEVPGEPLYVDLTASVVRVDRGDRKGVALRWGMHTMEVANRFARIVKRLRQKSQNRAADGTTSAG